MKKTFQLFFLIALLSFSSCKNKNIHEASIEDINKGNITILCDESFQYLMDQEVRCYENIFSNAHIQMKYLPEGEIFKSLVKDSFVTAVIARKLTEAEDKMLTNRVNLRPKQHVFARDAVAILANTSFKDSIISYETLKQLFSNNTAQIPLVFDNKQSGIVNYMFNLNTQKNLKGAFALNSTDEVIDYLQKDDKALGFVSFAEISDRDVVKVRELLKKVKLISISQKDSTGKTIVSTASQSDIATKEYPLQRPLNYILYNEKERLGTGFVNFLFMERSERIIVKSGLIPSIMPERLVTVNTNGLSGK